MKTEGEEKSDRYHLERILSDYVNSCHDANFEYFDRKNYICVSQFGEAIKFWFEDDGNLEEISLC